MEIPDSYFRDQPDTPLPTCTAVGWSQSRPVCRNSDETDFIVGEIKSYVDLRLTNSLGEERVIRVEIPNETHQFWTKQPDEKGDVNVNAR